MQPKQIESFEQKKKTSASGFGGVVHVHSYQPTKLKMSDSVVTFNAMEIY